MIRKNHKFVVAVRFGSIGIESSIHRVERTAMPFFIIIAQQSEKVCFFKGYKRKKENNERLAVET